MQDIKDIIAAHVSVRDCAEQAQSSDYAEQCRKAALEAVAGRTGLSSQFLDVSVKQGRVCSWVCLAEFKLSAKQKITRHSDRRPDAPDIVPVGTESELTAVTENFFAEVRKIDIFHDISSSADAYQPGRAWDKEIAYRHPIRAVHEQRCGSCKGKRSILCEQCNGNGKIPCSGCAGEGKIRCNICGDDNKVVCLRCHGSGKTAHSVTRGVEHQRCATCGGTGRVGCLSCSGAGHTTCGQCEGKGSITCAHCGGKKSMLCVDCNCTGLVHDIGEAYLECPVSLNMHVPDGLVFDPALPGGESALLDSVEDKPGGLIAKAFACRTLLNEANIVGPGGRTMTVHMQGEPPVLIRDYSEMFDSFVSESIQAIARDAGNIALLSKNFPKAMLKNLSSILQFNVVREGLYLNKPSRVQMEARKAMANMLNRLNKFFMLRNIMNHVPLLILAAVLFTKSGPLGDFHIQNNTRSVPTLFTMYAFAQGGAMGLISYFRSRNIVARSSTDLKRWVQKRGLIYGVAETGILLGISVIAAAIMPLGW